MAQEFQSTLPARGATRWFGRSPKQNSISIHAPRTGSDSYSNFAYARCKNFNPRSPHGERRKQAQKTNGWEISIHAPRTGSDSQHGSMAASKPEFQSTLPARGATNQPGHDEWLTRHFNPRSPHGERRLQPANCAASHHHFNPRSPHGERQRLGALILADGVISIHAPRTGSDPMRSPGAHRTLRISIHAPRTGSDVSHPFLIYKR